MEALWKQFVKEQTYLRGVSPRTVEWYGCIWKAFSPFLGQIPASGEGLKEALKEAVTGLRQNGLQPISLNSYLSGLNSFLRWAHREGHLKELVVVPKIKCEQKIISTFTEEQVKRLLAWKPPPDAERPRGEFQRTAARRMPERELVRHAGGGTTEDRGVAAGLQQRASRTARWAIGRHGSLQPSRNCSVSGEL